MYKDNRQSVIDFSRQQDQQHLYSAQTSTDSYCVTAMSFKPHSNNTSGNRHNSMDLAISPSYTTIAQQVANEKVKSDAINKANELSLSRFTPVVAPSSTFSMSDVNCISGMSKYSAFCLLDVNCVTSAGLVYRPSIKQEADCCQGIPSLTATNGEDFQSATTSTQSSASIAEILDRTAAVCQKTNNSSSRSVVVCQCASSSCSCNPSVTAADLTSQRDDGSLATIEGLFSCAFCKEQFVSATSLSEHMSCHGIVCNMKLANDGDSRLSFNSDDSSTVVEPGSSNMDPSNSNLKPGEIYAEPHENKLQCCICDRIMPDEPSLDTHLNSHSGNDKYRCMECCRCFLSVTDLQRHSLIHSGEKPYRCEFCGRRFVQSGHLTSHLQTHSGSKPFRCTLCDKMFRSSGHLNEHMTVHSDAKPYRCDVCNSTFARPNYLRKHMHIHSMHRPYKCDLCSLEFTMHSTLLQHQRTHSGEKPFSCLQCNRKFTRLGSLTVHMRSHTGERPYRCSECSKDFAQLSVLKVHMRIHTRIHKEEQENTSSS